MADLITVEGDNLGMDQRLGLSFPGYYIPAEGYQSEVLGRREELTAVLFKSLGYLVTEQMTTDHSGEELLTYELHDLERNAGIGYRIDRGEVLTRKALIQSELGVHLLGMVNPPSVLIIPGVTVVLPYIKEKLILTRAKIEPRFSVAYLSENTGLPKMIDYDPCKPGDMRQNSSIYLDGDHLKLFINSGLVGKVRRWLIKGLGRLERDGGGIKSITLFDGSHEEFEAQDLTTRNHVSTPVNRSLSLAGYNAGENLVCEITARVREIFSFLDEGKSIMEERK